jgi:hypothetical protein
MGEPFSHRVLFGVNLFPSIILPGPGTLLGIYQNCTNRRAGVIGPQRIFGPGSIYTPILYFWLLGALLPVAFYLLMRFFPRSKARFLNAPVYVIYENLLSTLTNHLSLEVCLVPCPGFHRKLTICPIR